MLWALARGKKELFALCDATRERKTDIKYIFSIYLEEIGFESQGSYD